MTKLNIKFKHILFFLFSVFSTMPCVTVTIAGRMISVFTILTPVVIVYLFFAVLNRRSQINNGTCYLLLFLCVSIISTFIGAIYYDNRSDFKTAALSYLPKIITYIVLALLMGTHRFNNKDFSVLVKGMLVGALLNIMWANLDGIGFYLTGKSINNIVFVKYINYYEIRYNSMSLIINGSIRASGFNYDPAHIGFLAVFVFGYSFIRGNYLIILLSLLSILMSQSGTAMVGCVLFLIYYMVTNKADRKKTLKKIGGLMLIACFLLLFVMLIDYDMLKTFIGRMFDKVGSDSVETSRITYNFKVFTAIFNAPINAILGTGFGTASYPYIKSGLIVDNFAFDPESTYVSYLFDVGIIGFICYIMCLLTAVKYTVKWRGCGKKRDGDINAILFAGIIAIIISQFFYHYTLYAPQMLLLLIGIAGREQIKSVEEFRQCDNGHKSMLLNQKCNL